MKSANAFRTAVTELAAKKTPLAIPEKVWTDPVYFFAFGLGSGAMPIAPGTFGTLLAIPFYLLLSALPLTYYVIAVVLFCILAMWACEVVSRKIETHDHPGMCIDEFAGFFVTMINAPLGFSWIVLGFLLFRFFDIVKPIGIRYLDEHVPGGIGMVLDDIAAGLASCFIIQIIHWLFA